MYSFLLKKKKKWKQDQGIDQKQTKNKGFYTACLKYMVDIYEFAEPKFEPWGI